jgi:hypothetical protein
MSDYQQIAQDTRSFFITNWDALSNGVPSSTHLQPDNDPEWKPPVDSNGDPEPWIRVVVEPADFDQSTFGAPSGGKYVFLGSFIVEVFVSSGSGTYTLDSLLDDAINVLRGKTTNGIFISDPRPVRVGLVDEIFFKYNVEATLRHFETAA